MPVEDPRADAKVYLAKHNVEKIFEVRLRPAPLRPAHWPPAALVLCALASRRAMPLRAVLPAPRPAGAS